jgi:hypothetical protein
MAVKRIGGDMFFLIKWWARLRYGSDEVDKFERERKQPKPQKRPQQRIKRRR